MTVDIICPVRVPQSSRLLAHHAEDFESVMTWKLDDEGRLLADSIARLRRELKVQHEVWPVWLERLNALMDNQEDPLKRLSEEEKSTRDKRTPISTPIEDWENPFPTDPFRFIGQRRGSPKVKRK